MYSIGRFISNFRDFYNDINGATLTGAIDVVVVQQPDGTYKCSPFHVRFGKLGVLRSKEKLVDIEINGEIRDIHMKLGESGEAFFVEGVYEDDSFGVPDHLATSPITISEFPLPFPAEEDVPKPRRNSIDFTEKLENQVSDYSHRRYTDGEGHQKREFSAPKREYTTQQLREQEVLKADGWVGEDKETGIFPIDDLETSTTSLTAATTPKTFKAEEITDNSKEDHCRKISILNNDFKPIDDSQENATEEIVDQKGEDGSSKNEENGKVSNKKKRRKKSVMKKKNAQRKNSNSSSGGSHSDAVESEATPTDTSAQTTISSPNEEGNSSGEVKDEPIESTIRHRDPDIHFFSDTEVGLAQSPLGSRPCTPVQSDTEFEVSQRQLKSEEDPTLKSTDSVQQSWKWGELPTPRPKIAAAMSEQITPEDEKKLNEEAKQAERNTMLSGMFSFMKQNKRLRSKTPVEGLYLADLSSEDMDPEVAALYFPSAQIHRKQNEDEGAREEDCESGNGPSLTQSPSSVEGACSGPKSLDYDFDDKHPDKHNDEVQLSMCGGLEASGPTEEEFQQNKLSYSDVCREPHLLSNPRLVVKLSGKYLSWKAACPIVMTQVVFQQPLPKSAIDQLCSDESIKSVNDKTDRVEDSSKQAGAGGRSWWYWRRSSDKTPSQKESEDLKAPEPPGHTFPETKVSESSEQNAETSASNNVAGSQGVLSETGLSQSVDNAQHKEDGYSGSQSSEESDVETARPNRPMPEKYRKTLRLSSEQIESLNLNEGMNEVVFSVTTAYQGTTRCKCYMYCWKYDDKVVISDIDGTITRSDVLGHILPIVGKDWAQSGVAQLFTKIKNNGYKLLYLSSRAIGQARVTREYLKSIKQNDLSMPDGPLLLNPTSLLSAFHREVIEKKPEQFKISCLSDIQALFPSDSKPFYAGYGNRINDVWAYRAVGIPIVRIFTINHRGELKHEQTHTFQSSYSNMSFIVDQLFPPLLEDASEFSHFVYWRIPLPDLPLLALGESTAVSTPTKTSGGTSPLPTIHENTITQ